MKIIPYNKAISFLILGLFLFGCERKITTRSSEIRISDYNNMVVNYYDTILLGVYGMSHFLNLDLDNNGSEDIQFESLEWGSLAAGHHPKSTISCLNTDVELYGFFTSDTLYLNRNTQIIKGINDIISIYENYNYSCYKIADNDSILQISPTFKIIPLNKNDILQIDDTFNCDTITLIDDSYSLPPYPIGNNGDTIIYEFRTYYNNCYTFPSDKIIYIGLKLYKKRLGWIKVSIFDKNKILIHESGIQE